MRKLIFASAAAVLALGVFASQRADAVVIVIGNSLGYQCYSSAETGNVTVAFDLCTKALNDLDMLARDKAATYVNRSVVRLRAGDYQGAINDCDASIAIMSSIAEAYIDKGAAYIGLDKPQEAIAALNQGIAIGFNKLHLAYFNRAMAREKMGDFRGAFADYKKSQELAPYYIPASEELKRFVANGMMM